MVRELEVKKSFEWYLTQNDKSLYIISKNLDLGDVLVIIDSLIKKFNIQKIPLMLTLYGNGEDPCDQSVVKKK